MTLMEGIDKQESDEEKNQLIQVHAEDSRESENGENEHKTSSTKDTKVQMLYTLIITSIFCAILITLSTINSFHSNIREKSIYSFPYTLFDSDSSPGGNQSGVYHLNDFRNTAGNVVPYWEDLSRFEFDISVPHVGPCYLPKGKQNWEKLMKKNQHNLSVDEIEYLDLSKAAHQNQKEMSSFIEDLSGLCRPGFIIIGAGKCGTSSLYHYLSAHPRVLPAREKQIHYFKYYSDYPMKWYLSHFPSATTFLSNGALMTGEASPGYLPEPAVAKRLLKWMTYRAGNGPYATTSIPKIITIVRNPLERSWSSYKYNYVTPAIEMLMSKDKTSGKYHHETYYHKFLFSFEELVEAELRNLVECLKPAGTGETETFEAFGWSTDFQKEFQRRFDHNLPKLIAIDDFCYGNDVPRRQFKHLTDKFPEKVINVPNMHLVQSIVGRSLYVLPLEFWYALYSRDGLYMFCNEDLRNKPAEAVSELSDFLGLPSFDFSSAVREGMFNVGFNSGYDTVTQWNDTDFIDSNEIPISSTLRQQFMSFVKPYNERLFALTGRTCLWS